MGKLGRALSLIFRRLLSFVTFGFAIGILLSYLSPFISPQKLWWIQLFGLAYPILFFTLLIIFVIYIFYKKKKALLLGVILLIGLPVHLRFFGFSGTQTKTEETNQTIKVMSYNVRLFDMYKWVDKNLKNSKARFLRSFKHSSPDVLCFQEYVEDNRKYAHITKKDIMEIGGFTDMIKKVTVQTESVNFGLAIYSKYPIIYDGIVNSNDNDISCVYVDILKNEDTVRIYNVHLQSIRFQQDEYSIFDGNAPTSKSGLSKIFGLLRKLKHAYPPRVKEATDILNHAQKCNYPVVICGDFNDPPISYIYSRFNEKFSDAFRNASSGIGVTYAGKIPAGRIDYIFYSDKLKAISFEKQQEALSDHYAITTELELLK